MKKLFRRCVSVVALMLLASQMTLGQVPRHGIQEFNASGTFEVPADVSQLVVELWGAGGGGGGGRSAAVGSGSGGSGGGGGSGAYVRAIVAVKGGEIYAIVVGAEGRSGTGESQDAAHAGLNGGETFLRIGTQTLLTARGGQGGGLAAEDNGRGGSGGPGRRLP